MSASEGASAIMRDRTQNSWRRGSNSKPRIRDDALLPKPPTLGDEERTTVKFICELCGRRGQYRKQTLIAQFGPHVLMPDLLHLVARCPRRHPTKGGCGVHYEGLT